MLNIQPREKQIVALNMLRGAWKQNNSFMLYAPVGFGKTAIAALITDGFVSREMRVMFVAPYTILLDQTATRFMEYGLLAKRSVMSGVITRHITRQRLFRLPAPIHSFAVNSLTTSTC